MIFTPKNKDELKEAVNLYYENKQEGIKKYGEINTWNTINITDMSELFKKKYYFNENISNWETKNVTNMSYMFACCYYFNQSLNFNTHKVTDMRFMFHNCYKLELKNVINKKYLIKKIKYCNLCLKLKYLFENKTNKCLDCVNSYRFEDYIK